MTSLRSAPFSIIAGAMLLAQGPAAQNATPRAGSVARVVVNDNRRPAGHLRAGVLTLRLDARLGDWHPDGEDAPGATVPAFAEEGGPARIPGPLIRVPAGTDIALTIRNTLEHTLTLRGLHNRSMTGSPSLTPPSSIELAPGASRTIRFRLDAPGTYYYYGSTAGQTIDWRSGDDSQLTGAIVVDPAGQKVPADRVFMFGVWSDTAGRVLARRTRILSVINGRSWPHTERFEFNVGDTVRWRLINGSADSHPMHLHGFYYRVDARGDGMRDTTYAPAQRNMANTERMMPGWSLSLVWVPERPGNWLFHCHLPDHFRASGPLGMPRAAPTPHMATNGHAAMNHALGEMNGLVLGVVVRGKRATTTSDAVEMRPPHDARLVIRPSAGGAATQPFYEFVLSKDRRDPPPDSGLHTGPTIVVVRGEPVRITVVNALDVPTSVHWHGIELESYYDGVPGFSGAGSRLAPLIAPHDSFVVRFTPPRAGTFIYHTHVDENTQQLAGLAGALIVLEPGLTFDSTTDHAILITTPPVWEDELRSVLINGHASPAPLVVRAGVAQRLRLINMTVRRPGARVELWRDTTLLNWRALAKDGMELPATRQVQQAARSVVSIGETLDFEFVPRAGDKSRLEVRGSDGALLASMPITVLTNPTVATRLLDETTP
jgi:FtsP/CotA-like multicopper oxidase with cupredoxin domain